MRLLRDGSDELLCSFASYLAVRWRTDMASDVAYSGLIDHRRRGVIVHLTIHLSLYVSAHKGMHAYGRIPELLSALRPRLFRPSLPKHLAAP
jgi:hypothetical protein